MDLTLESIFKSQAFVAQGIQGVQWLPDGKSFTFQKNKAIYRQNVADEEPTLLVNEKDLVCQGSVVEMSEYFATGEQNHLLIAGAQTPLWRHSYTSSFYIYNISKKSLTPLANGDPLLQNVQFSPDNKQVAFIKSSNLHVTDVETGVVRALTQDGNENILNGIFDWVYEEEFGRVDAFRWSPDSKKIAFWRLDQTKVKSWLIYDETSQRYPTTSNLKYPKVGELNSVVSVGVVDVATGEIVWLDIGKNEETYIPRIDWTASDSVLSIQTMNRTQNHWQLLFYNLKTKEMKPILTETSETGWIDVTDDLIFFKEKDEFIWTNERSGYRHIYLCDYNGGLKQITTGDWEVSSIIGLDQKNGWIYFSGKKDGPENEVVYRVQLDGTQFTSLGTTPGWYAASFSPDYGHCVMTYNRMNLPDQVALLKSDGTLVKQLVVNDLPAMSSYNLSWPEFGVLKNEHGDDMTYHLTKPTNFNPTNKYPVIVFGYSGPAHQVSINRWIRARNLWHAYMASKGFVIFCVDHRGCSGRGKAFKHYAYKDLSKYMVEDQICGAKFLQSLPYVDGSRIGFWGWSGGGYLSCMLSCRANDYFSTCVAVASVTDFRNYDTIWTERYMGLLNENLEGYKAADVLTYTKQQKGNLLLIHGTGDDNVHPQNTMMFVEALVQANKQFDMMLYPNRNHGIYGGNTTFHLFSKISNYFIQHLNSSQQK